MKTQKIFKYLLLVLLITASNILGNQTKTTNTPWDTVIAKLQVIESMNRPDSVRVVLTQKLFSDYDLSADNYGKFYDKFLKKPPDQQVEFLKKVENILLKMMQKVQEIRR
jgi:hypothetical protein